MTAVWDCSCVRGCVCVCCVLVNTFAYMCWRRFSPEEPSTRADLAVGKKKKDDYLFIEVCTNSSLSSIRCRGPLSPLLSNCLFLSDCRVIDFFPKKTLPSSVLGHGEMDVVIYDPSVVSHSIKARNVFPRKHPRSPSVRPRLPSCVFTPRGLRRPL